MIKANSTAVTKITSVQWITPDSKNSKQVVKSLEEWPAKNIVSGQRLCAKPSKRR
jgi:hypothetical protein